MTTPQLVFMRVAGPNLSGGIAGNNFTYNVPGLAGNALLAWLSWPASSAAPTISDNVNGTWPAVTTIISGATGKQSVGYCLITGIAAGIATVKAAFAGNVIPFQWEIIQYSNITGSNGSVGAVVAGPNLAAGSFTPGNNNANGGNLIVSYFSNTAYTTTAAGPNPWVVGSGATLLEADMTGVVNFTSSFAGGFNHAAQELLQTTSAAINPGITATGDTTNSYNCAAVALTVGVTGSGPPSTISVIKIISQSVEAAGGGPNPATSVKLQIPWTGNLRFGYAGCGGQQAYTSITDSDGDTWNNLNTIVSGTADFFGYAENTSADTNATLVFAQATGFYQGTYHFYDIANADPNAFDNWTPGTNPPANLNSATVLTNFPAMAPYVSQGLAITYVPMSDGPGLSVTSPPGAVFDFISYTGETDADQYDNADLGAHYYFNTCAEQNWSWTLTSQGSNAIGGVSGTITFASAGAPGVRNVGTGAYNNGTTTVALAYPAGIVAGDLAVAVVSSQNGTINTSGVKTPAGWTFVGSGPNLKETTGGYYCQMFVFQQTYVSGSTQTFTASVSGTGIDGFIRAFSDSSGIPQINAFASSMLSTSSSAAKTNTVPPIIENYVPGEIASYYAINDNTEETAVSLQLSNALLNYGGTQFSYYGGDYNWNFAPGSFVVTYSGYACGAVGFTIAPPAVSGSAGTSSGSGTAGFMRDYDLSLPGWFSKVALPIIDWFDRDEPAGGPSSYAVIADFAGAFEWIGSLHADLTSAAETSESVRVDAAPSAEILLGVRSDIVITGEDLASARADAAVPAESGASVRNDAPATSEILLGVHHDSHVSVEIMGALIVTSDGLVNIESIASLRADQATAEEATAGVRADIPPATESAALARIDATIAAESLLGVHTDGALAIECALSVRRDGAAPLEIVGALVVTADSMINIEALAGVAAAAPAPAESIAAAIVSNAAIAAEVLAVARRDAAATAEVLLSVRGESPGEVEIVGNLVVIGDGRINIETAAGVVVNNAAAAETGLAAVIGAAAVLEILAGARGDASAATEVLLSSRGEGVSPLEIGGAVAKDLAIAAESIGALNRGHGLSLEISGMLSGGGGVFAVESLASVLREHCEPIEIIVSVAGDGNMAPEIVAAVIGFSADGLLNIEILGSLTADQAAALSSRVTQTLGVRFKGRAAGVSIIGRAS